MPARVGTVSRVAGFPESSIEEIRSKTDIVGLISEYVALKKRGRNYVGLCPFHSERTPSFNVVPDKQIFHCFGCQAGGDVFRFVQLRENLGFPEAVRLLADRSGVDLAATMDPAANRRLQEQERLRQALEWAARYFQYELLQDGGRESLDYLRRRGLTDETIQRFGLGVAPDSWDALFRLMTRRGFEPETLAKAGLTQPRNSGQGYYDRFRHRVMFPIWDIRGRVIGFGGRALEDGKGPKYLNSPESILFEKGRNLYALHLAKGAMRTQDQAVIVEGYMDAIACHQAGVTHVVASLGTALTEDQGRLLLQQTPRVIIAYDSDTAGQNATLRGLEILGGMGCQVSVLSLPEGKDPDEFLRSHSPAEFEQAAAAAKPLVEFRLARALEKFGAASPEAKAQVVRTALPVFAGLTDEVRRGEYVRWLAGRLNVKEEDLRLDLKKFMSRQTAASRHSRGKSWHNTGEVLAGGLPPEPAPAADLPKEWLAAERLVIQLLLQDARLLESQAGFKAALLEHPVYRRIAEATMAVRQETAAADAPDPARRVLDRLEREEDKRTVTTLLASPRSEGDTARSLADCIQTIHQHILKRRLAELHVVIEQSGSEAERLAALQEYQQVVGQTKRPKVVSE